MVAVYNLFANHKYAPACRVTSYSALYIGWDSEGLGFKYL